MTDVFISYAREDSAFVRRIFESLKQNDREAWVDWEDIPLTADWLAEAYAGIEGADTFLFVISPASVRSGPCTLELEHALQNNKRLIPLLRREVADPEDQKLMHSSLSSHNWVQFRENDDYEKAIGSVLMAIDTDLEHVKAHTRYVVRASEWDAKGRDKSFLLNGNDLLEAERWLKASETKSPQANNLQREYILAGRAEANRRRSIRTITTLVILIMTILALLALFQSVQATNNAAQARAAEATAHYNADQADSSALAAYAQQALYREHNVDLAIPLALEANRLEQVPALARTILAQAAYAPGTRHLYTGYALYPDADMAVTPDYQKALSVTADETLQLWDIETAKVLQTWDFGDTSGQRPWTVHVSPDGKLGLVTLQDGSLILLNLETGEQSQPWPYEAFARYALFTPDGKNVLVGYATTGNVVMWDIATGGKLATYHGTDGKTVYSIATTLDGSKLAAGFDDGSIFIWNVDGGEQLGLLTDNTGDTTMGIVRSVTFSPNGTELLSGSDDKVVRLWQLGSDKPKTFSGHTDRIRSVTFSPDGQTAFSASYDGHVIQWNLDKGISINVYVGHVATVYTVINMPEGRILTGSSDGTIRLWDTENGAEIQRFNGHTGTVYAVAFTPDGTKAVTASADKSLKVWDLQTRELIQTLCCHDDWVWGLAVSPDGTKAISASRDKTLILWDLESGEKIRTFTGHTDGVWSVVFSPNGQTVLSGSRDSSLILWDVATGRIIRRFQGHTSPIYGIAISPDGRYALSASSDKTINYWDIETGTIIRTLKGHKSTVYTVAFSPDGTEALSGSQDLTMILWDLSTGDIIRQFTGPTSDITSVAFAKDGHRALSGSLDNGVRLWNLDTGAEMLLYAGHTDGVWNIAFSPDNHTILSGGRDQTARLWRIDTFNELTRWTYQNRYILPLTCEQRKLYRIETQCDSGGHYATWTPHPTLLPVTPTPQPASTEGAPQTELTATPSLTPLPTLLMGEPFKGLLAPGANDLYYFEGHAGEIVTISLKADKPANEVTDETTQIEQSLLDTDMFLYAPNGSFLIENDDVADGQTDSTIAAYTLPNDGLYVIRIANARTAKVGGGYTMLVQEGALPTPSPSNTPEATDTPQPG